MSLTFIWSPATNLKDNDEAAQSAFLSLAVLHCMSFSILGVYRVGSLAYINCHPIHFLSYCLLLSSPKASYISYCDGNHSYERYPDMGLWKP